MDYAFQFVINNHGIDTEEDYPYRAQDGTCKKEKVSFIFPVCPCFDRILSSSFICTCMFLAAWHVDFCSVLF